MRTLLVVVLVVLVMAAVAPRAAAVCVPRKPGAAGKPVLPPKPKLSVPGKAKPMPMPMPGGDIVKALCAKTDYPDVCLSSIAKQPPPPGGKKLDGVGVLRLAMAAVRAKSAEARKAAVAFVADPKTPKLAIGPLNDCNDYYEDISYSLDHADKAMVAGDMETTGTMLDAVCTNIETCDQGFEDRDGLTPLMAKYESELAKLSSNCLAIAAAAGLR